MPIATLKLVEKSRIEEAIRFLKEARELTERPSAASHIESAIYLLQIEWGEDE